MSDYKVVMMVRMSARDELMAELTDIDFDALGVMVVYQEDASFDAYIAMSSGTTVIDYEG